MRLMYDSVNSKGCPPNAAIYAGYVNGHWPSYASMVRDFPTKIHIPISVSADTVAQVLDVERFDALPEEAPDWVILCKKNGIVAPNPYCSLSNVPAVRDAFTRRGMEVPEIWYAHDNDDPVFETVPGVTFVAKQYRQNIPYNNSLYDASSGLDFWFGVDQVPDPPDPPISEETMVIVPVDTTGDGKADQQWLLGGPGTYSHVVSTSDYNALLAAGIPKGSQMISQAQHQIFLSEKV